MRNAFFRLIAALVFFGVSVGMIISAMIVKSHNLGFYACGALVVAAAWVSWELLLNHDDL